MNLTMRYAAAGVVGLLIGGAIIYVWGPGKIKQVAAAECPFEPPSGGSMSYGFVLADSGKSHIALGTLYFISGGFKHNIAILDLPDTAPITTYNVGPPCTTPQAGGAQFAMTDPSSGKAVGTVTFNSSPSVGSNATYGIEIVTTANDILPVSSMSGDAYLMN